MGQYRLCDCDLRETVVFEDDRDLVGYEEVEADGKRWRLEGLHEAADGTVDPRFFDAVSILEPAG